MAGSISVKYVHGLLVAAKFVWTPKEAKCSFSRSSTTVDVDGDPCLLAATGFEWSSKDGIQTTVVTVAEHCARK